MVSETDLLEFLRPEIGERAALPKHVRIVSRMPLTAVGKIFKPELKRLETKDALEAALREALELGARDPERVHHSNNRFRVEPLPLYDEGKGAILPRRRLP